ncbi:MAG: hypothetical protein ACOY3I_08210 [Verrucomicrobiota bacterium]
MSTIDTATLISLLGYDTDSSAASTTASSTTTSETDDSQDSYTEQQALFASALQEVINAGIYDIHTVQEFDSYEPTSTATSSSSSATTTTTDTESSTDTSTIVDAVAASIESATMSLLASMTPSNSGINVLGYLYAQNGIVSSLSQSSTSSLQFSA